MFLKLEQYLCHLLAVHACQICVSNAQYLVSAAQALVLKKVAHSQQEINVYLKLTGVTATQYKFIVGLCMIVTQRPKNTLKYKRNKKNIATEKSLWKLKCLEKMRKLQISQKHAKPQTTRK